MVVADHAAENVKNSDDIGGEDQQFPAENKCNHVFERWRGGILAIGTLGYDPLKDEDQQLNDYFYHDVVVSCEQEYQRDSDDDDGDDESSEDFGEEEENPLVVAAYSCNAGGLMREAEEMEENWKHEFEYVMMEKKERTTLADLFHADSQDHNDDVVLKKQAIADLSKEKSNRKRRRLLFRNNLMAKDARPIHKLNQVSIFLSFLFLSNSTNQVLRVTSRVSLSNFFDIGWFVIIEWNE